MLLVGIGLAIAGALSAVAGSHAFSGPRTSAPDLNRFLSGTAPASTATPSGPTWFGLGPTGPSNPKALANMVSAQAGSVEPIGPVLFAYDGSNLAGFAIAQAARQLETGPTRWCCASGSR